MRYFLFGGLMFSIGVGVGWLIHGIVTREKLRRDLLRAQQSNAPKSTIDRLFEEL